MQMTTMKTYDNFKFHNMQTYAADDDDENEAWMLFGGPADSTLIPPPGI